MSDRQYDYRIVVLGDPRAQKRHRHTSRGPDGKPLKFTRTYDPSVEDKENLRVVVQAQAPDKPLIGPLRVDVYTYWSRPKSHYGTGRNEGVLKASAPLWKHTKPDRDNLDKIILDALQGVFWANDSQICDGRIVKQYNEKPRTEIYITRLDQKETKETKELCICRR